MTDLIPGADVWGVPSPSQLVSDCQTAGFQIVGGYAYDDDVLGGNPWTAGHVQALQAAGIGFFPIITLRNGSGATVATLVAALKALGCMSGPVGWDREDTTAVPPEADFAPLVAGVRAAGYGPFIGYRYPYLNVESWYASLMDTIWAAVPGGASVPPPGWNSIQYGQRVVNGTAYDVDTFAPSTLGGDDLTPTQAQQLQDCYNWLAGTGNQLLALMQAQQQQINTLMAQVQALYNWDAGTGNELLASLNAVKGKLGV